MAVRRKKLTSLEDLLREQDHQKQVIAYVDTIGRFQHPELAWLYAIPNYSGKTNYQTHQWYLAQGKRPGVPDLCLPVAKMGYHALYIEMKTRKTKVEKGSAQEGWIEGLRRGGNCVIVCHSGEEAIDTLTKYVEEIPF